MPSGLLIVDDNANIRYLIRVFVESNGYQVCGEAVDGCEAIEKAKELQPDLILLDLLMPRMNGVEAASVLKRIMPRVPIILFSMQVDSVGRTLAAAIGVDLLLSKSDGISKLNEHLKTLLNPPRGPEVLGLGP
jgi:two-component system chemotaxis response regulator CheY